MKRLLAIIMIMALMMTATSATASGKPMVIYLDDVLGCGGEWRCPVTNDALGFVQVDTYSFNIDDTSKCYRFTITGMEATHSICFPFVFFASPDSETPLFIMDYDFFVTDSLDVYCRHMEFSQYTPPCEE